MKVVLLSHTQDIDELVVKIAKICYGGSPLDPVSPREIEAMIRALKVSGHTSVFEHASFTFYVEGVDRALTHQLVRHRMGSYTQRSQRYVNEEDFEYYTPESISNYSESLDKYKDVMEVINEAYQELIDIGVPKEDARMMLPNACTTGIVFTMNVRGLFNFLSLRLCKRTQKPLRILASNVLSECMKVAPKTFNRVGAKCINNECAEVVSCKDKEEM